MLADEIDIIWLNEFIALALEEDIGAGDYSTLCCVSEKENSIAQLKIKEDCILAGVAIAEYIFGYAFAEKQTVFHSLIEDGMPARKGNIAFEVEGSAQKILMLERLTLNCMQRMSGIATVTQALTAKIADLPTRLLDTRKTTPGIRPLEKMAVRMGGGFNHRLGLYDMIMLKDNHIAASGGIEKAIQCAREYLQKNNLDLLIEIEVQNLEEVNQVVSYGGIDRIMLDNFTPAEIRAALDAIAGAYQTEASGGITADNIREYALTGVDFISTSQTIQSVKSIDLSLKISS